MFNNRVQECTCGSKRVVSAFSSISRGKAIDCFCNDCGQFYSFTVTKHDKPAYVKFYEQQKEKLTNGIQHQ